MSLPPQLLRLWNRLRKGPAERRTARERAHFWAQVREGQREAEARARPLEKQDRPVETPS